MNISVIGQGYVGLNLSVGASAAGHNVTGIDVNNSLVNQLNLGISHIEGISDESLQALVRKRKFKASTDFAEVQGAEIVVLAVPTPLDPDGRPDLFPLHAAVVEMSPHLREGTLVISESTSYIGTLRNLIAKNVMALNQGVKDFAVSPERVDPGNQKFNLSNTPRIVGGTSPSATDKAADFYLSFCDNVIKVRSPEIAEASKLLENSFRFVNIGFINEFTQVLNSMNIRATEVIAAAATKPYGFMSFLPNIGVGGHCIPVDPLYFQKNAIEVNLKSRYIELSENMNLEMPDYTINRLEKFSGSLDGKHILIVGVAYKPDIADTRESPAARVLNILKARGAKVSWHDPLVKEFEGIPSSSISGNYDLALVLVKHLQLDMSMWNGNPIYCVNPIPSEPAWISLLSPHPEL